MGAHGCYQVIVRRPSLGPSDPHNLTLRWTCKFASHYKLASPAHACQSYICIGVGRDAPRAEEGTGARPPCCQRWSVMHWPALHMHAPRAEMHAHRAEGTHRMKAFMLSKIERPSRTAATMVEKLSSARTMSLASLATSVPEMPIATPMSARRSAGASLTPSPVNRGRLRSC